MQHFLHYIHYIMLQNTMFSDYIIIYLILYFITLYYTFSHEFSILLAHVFNYIILYNITLQLVSSVDTLDVVRESSIDIILQPIAKQPDTIATSEKGVTKQPDTIETSNTLA